MHSYKTKNQAACDFLHLSLICYTVVSQQDTARTQFLTVTKIIMTY